MKSMKRTKTKKNSKNRLTSISEPPPELIEYFRLTLLGTQYTEVERDENERCGYKLVTKYALPREIMDREGGSGETLA